MYNKQKEIEQNKIIFNKNYYETLAKLILETIPNRKIVNLIQGDRPDLLNDSIGVEVTRAISTRNGEIDGFIMNNIKSKYSELPEKQLIKLGFVSSPEQVYFSDLYTQYSPKHGMLYYIKSGNDLLLLGFLGKMSESEETIKSICKSIVSKVRKMENYEQRPENDLAIIVNEQLNYIGFEDETINTMKSQLLEMLKRIVKEKEQHKMMFDKVFIIFLDNLFEIECCNMNCNHYSIPKEKMELFLKEAAIN